MNGLYRFALILLVIVALFYFISQRSQSVPIKNEGSLQAQAGAPVNMPNVDYDMKNDIPYEEPAAGSPEMVTGAGLARVNWEGLAENQLNAGLSKQYQELSADDLLPYNDMAHWADIYPSGTGQLQNKNFLHAGHHIGINTVGQMLKNPNYGLRSEPANPQIQVSPWLQSSYSPDLLRPSFELGNCA